MQRKSSNNKVEYFTTTQNKVATFLPMDLQIDGEVVNDLRKRGIFKVPLYKAELSFSGHFSKPDFSSWGVSDDDILWDRAYLSVGLTDSRGIVKQSEITWLDSKIDFLSGTGTLNSSASGIHAPLKGLSSQSEFKFSFPLVLLLLTIMYLFLRSRFHDEKKKLGYLFGIWFWDKKYKRIKKNIKQLLEFFVP